ncbi:MAG: hypothetical protein BSOLF_1639 [Candidatus Carbobacillus altaicus]|uniref:Uncharacterized protein n=1 Tax=Candidatus Carbonibacillus altaicus TaxID=2163959 RepID=A0A2R6Y3T2_9BACL|nr:MAG: hypothetical protein BSOLF_1639 [Candidatus Carbobacillus altaicus]
MWRVINIKQATLALRPQLQTRLSKYEEQWFMIEHFFKKEPLLRVI